MSKLRNEAATPGPLFQRLHEEYRFEVDMCAVDWNAKLPSFLSPEDNSLALFWGGLRGYCNPPYVDISPWLDHALEPDFVMYLLPARTDRVWWKAYKPLAECHYLVGRVNFIAPPGLVYPSNPTPNVLFLFGEGTTPGLEVYRDAKTGERL